MVGKCALDAFLFCDVKPSLNIHRKMLFIGKFIVQGHLQSSNFDIYSIAIIHLSRRSFAKNEAF